MFPRYVFKCDDVHKWFRLASLKFSGSDQHFSELKWWPGLMKLDFTFNAMFCQRLTVLIHLRPVSPIM